MTSVTWLSDLQLQPLSVFSLLSCSDHLVNLSGHRVAAMESLICTCALK